MFDKYVENKLWLFWEKFLQMKSEDLPLFVHCLPFLFHWLFLNFKSNIAWRIKFLQCIWKWVANICTHAIMECPKFAKCRKEEVAMWFSWLTNNKHYVTSTNLLVEWQSPLIMKKNIGQKIWFWDFYPSNYMSKYYLVDFIVWSRTN